MRGKGCAATRLSGVADQIYKLTAPSWSLLRVVTLGEFLVELQISKLADVRDEERVSGEALVSLV